MSDFDQRPRDVTAPGGRGKLEEGREAYRQRAWASACRSLSLADQATPLGAHDLELLAVSAFLVGRDDDYLMALGRAHHLYLDAGEAGRAARSAFWLGLFFALREESARATGWLARAQRLLEHAGRDCVEQGYLLLPAAEQHLASGDWERASAAAARAVEIGIQFKEPDLFACAQHVQGRVLMKQGQIEPGLALLDEAMVAVSAGELSPVMTGLIYCSVIEACQQVYALSRAREWTAALARWCDAQPEMVAFTGICLVHRAEIMQSLGAWEDAIEEARRACERTSGRVDRRVAAAAFYQQAEVQRLRGAFAAAEEAYQRASQCGWDPQPGLALLRAAQGRGEAAVAAIRRATSEITDKLQRTQLLSACVEIMLAVRDLDNARSACRELEEIAASFPADVLHALAAQARGAVELAEGNAQGALGPLRRALDVWRRVEVPYRTATVRVLVALACRTLGDDDGAELELDGARTEFEQLGAAPEVARIDSLTKTKARPPAHPHGLTLRELQVLRLVATGKTNKAIAAELFLSEKTVERHLSNIFTKLDVPSRTAATAYAYEHALIQEFAAGPAGNHPPRPRRELGGFAEAEPGSGA